MSLPASVLTKKQERVFIKKIGEYRNRYGLHDVNIRAVVRYDDRCGNGHNTFSITGSITGGSSGCIHDEIAEHFPDLAKYIKWHLCSSDGPMHYIENTTYHAKRIDAQQNQYFVWMENKILRIKKHLLGIFNGEELEQIRKHYPPQDVITTEDYLNPMAKEPDLELARSSAIWPDATLEQLRDKAALKARLPALMDEFKAAVEELGFTY